MADTGFQVGYKKKIYLPDDEIQGLKNSWYFISLSLFLVHLFEGKSKQRLLREKSDLSGFPGSRNVFAWCYRIRESQKKSTPLCCLHFKEELKQVSGRGMRL
ncbi:hypothetical protein CEXT_476411 [Caerostris extrusa]|uniref:Uncharacterized protein n=1 Tax=Caerostris extrusa TaxID=172846 RepID=A0AAV4SJX9_CAEEX|nr:hypothetical protein CEXT_476411 [Caerostris extrusa]